MLQSFLFQSSGLGVFKDRVASWEIHFVEPIVEGWCFGRLRLGRVDPRTAGEKSDCSFHVVARSRVVAGNFHKTDKVQNISLQVAVAVTLPFLDPAFRSKDTE